MSAALSLVPPQAARHHDGREGTIDPATGGLWVGTDDGGLELDPNWKIPPSEESKGHTANLLFKLDSMARGMLADDVHRGISADDLSRRDWLGMTADAIKETGIKVEKPGAAGAETPVEGMSTVRNPMLMDCVIGFQADTLGEMLPASGPAKIRNDAGGELDPQATALETDFNHWLTSVATEYYPDTDRGLFAVGLEGGIVKKVFRCARRGRPVSEVVYLKDIIVNAGATDLDNAIRVTHQTTITHADLQTMMDDGMYADVPVGSPVFDPDPATRAGADALGVSLMQPDMEADHQHTIWECYCKKKLFDDKEPSPYRITLDKDSRQILEIRRNWKEDDKDRKPKRVFVMWPYLLTHLGFYPLGLFHLLGNTNMALTAAWRMGQDAVMFGNFPGFLFSEGFGKQLSNIFRVAPGGGVGIQTGDKPISEMVMPLPYKGLEPTMLPWVQMLQTVGEKLGGRAQVQVGEGSQNTPVGTMLAQIEQAMRPVSAVAKRLHQAQGQEFAMLIDLFREDPEALWRDNPTPAAPWDEQMLLQALENYDLVPVSDPNTPSQMHRVAKALMVFQMAQAAPMLFEPPVTARWLLQAVKVDAAAAGLKTPEKFAADMAAQAQQAPPQGGKPPDPNAGAELQLKAKIADQQMQTEQLKAGLQQQEQQADAAQQQTETQAQAQEALVESQDRAADRESHERIAAMKLQGDREKLDASREAAANDHAVKVAGLATAPPDEGEA